MIELQNDELLQMKKQKKLSITTAALHEQNTYGRNAMPLNISSGYLVHPEKELNTEYGNNCNNNESRSAGALRRQV